MVEQSKMEQWLEGHGAATRMTSESGSQSTYLHEEVGCFARAINKALKDEPSLKDRLPINPEGDDLFTALSDGMILIYLMRSIDPKLIDMSKVN